jgi:hypothetical protein
VSGRVVELVGVYHARGSLRGELAYAVGKLLGTAHCGLCDITHAVVRRKPAWDSMVAGLGVPVTLLHLDELPADVSEACRRSGTPVVLARLEDHGLRPVLDAGALDGLDGSVTGFERALRASGAAQGLTWG